jgi:hypothetical protein
VFLSRKIISSCSANLIILKRKELQANNLFRVPQNIHSNTCMEIHLVQSLVHNEYHMRIPLTKLTNFTELSSS